MPEAAVSADDAMKWQLFEHMKAVLKTMKAGACPADDVMERELFEHTKAVLKTMEARASSAEVTGPSASWTHSLGGPTGSVAEAAACAYDFVEPPDEPFVHATSVQPENSKWKARKAAQKCK